jgi:hypothetical protein
MRSRNHGEPNSAGRPRRAKAVVIRAPDAANRTSADSASTNPIPAHAPLIAAITGLRKSESDDAGRDGGRSGLVDVERSLSDSMSIPGQKPRPAPVSTTTRTAGSSSSPSTTSKNRRCMVHVQAFIRLGRFRVTVATPRLT